MRYKTVLFDADGTLLDFPRSEREAFTEAMALSGVSADDEMIDAYSKINDGLWKKLEKGEIERSFLLYRRFELVCELYGCRADAKKLCDDYIKSLSKKGYMIDGAEELLKKLHGKVEMYIITNGVEYVQRGRCKACGLERYFDGIFISECVGFYKPDVRYFEYVANNIEDFNIDKTLVVGDSLSSDIKGGNTFKIDTCWYNSKGSLPSGDVLPTFDARSFKEIYKIIEGGM